jgi:lincosamide nucleotidyltransferase A/C/D/E
MTADDVVEVLEWLQEANLVIWVDGGWGVDALVGVQTRPHTDLDLALDQTCLGRARETLERRGFHQDTTADPGLPARLVMQDQRGRQVDLHPLVFTGKGGGWQQLSETGKAWGRYPDDDLRSIGVVGARDVRCVSPGLQFRFRMGYEWSSRDEHDLRLLIDRFDMPAPPPLG